MAESLKTGGYHQPQASANESRTAAPPLPVNPDLVWDYDLPADEQQSEAFRRWYIARVLTRGQAKDIQAIGLDTILSYFPQLALPAKIRRFWEWYFSLPEVRQRCGTLASSAT